jgi:hypothetical protein
VRPYDRFIHGLLSRRSQVGFAGPGVVPDGRVHRATPSASRRSESGRGRPPGSD